MTGLSEGNKVLKYEWYRKCTFDSCEIRDRDPCYRVVADTLLVDVTSENNVGRYHCIGEPVTVKKFTTDIALAS